MPPPDKEEGRPARNGLHHTTPAATIPDYGLALFAQHSELLTASAISPEVARERRYVSVDPRARLKRYNDRFSSRRPVPGMLIPLRRLDGSGAGCQYRPDPPRMMAGRPRKSDAPLRAAGLYRRSSRRAGPAGGPCGAVAGDRGGPQGRLCGIRPAVLRVGIRSTEERR